jgi:hypothetical protein
MKKIIAFIFTFFTVSISIYSQSLGKNRVDRIRKSVVQILIEGKATGTGFFINDKGWIATCNHVIQPAFNRNEKSLNIESIKPISVELENGEIIEVGVMNYFVGKGYRAAFGYDYILLTMFEKPKTKFAYLKLGNWSDISDGDEVYASGYPLGIEQQFISKGVLSTKYDDTIVLKKGNIPKDTITRKVAWSDITITKGNSGGPILKLEKNWKKDRVIGLISYQLLPLGSTSSELSRVYLDSEPNLPSHIISNNKALGMLFGAVAQNSLGISGVISIDYLYSTQQFLNLSASKD